MLCLSFFAQPGVHMDGKQQKDKNHVASLQRLTWEDRRKVLPFLIYSGEEGEEEMGAVTNYAKADRRRERVPRQSQNWIEMILFKKYILGVL